MGFNIHANLFFVLFMLCFYVLDFGIATDTITPSESIKDPETIISKDGNFTLGFFIPPNSTNTYVGIWWKSQSTVVWVANRNQPLNDSSGVVTFSEDGNLVVLNGQNQVLWSSTFVSNTSTNTSAQLSDEGKLELTETTTGNSLWDSFQQPSDTLLPQMKISSNRTGRGVGLTSWKNPSDPSVGNFSLGVVERGKIVEVFIWNETQPYWRSGPWSVGVFTGVEHMASAYLNSFSVVDGEISYNPSASEFGIYVLSSQGQFEEKYWDDEKKELELTWTSKQSDCDVYGVCGSFAICDAHSQGTNGSPMCSCLEGFEPNNKEEWDAQNFTSGCFRSTPLQCERVNDENTTVDTNVDQFLELQMVKVPDFSEWSSAEPETCRSQCLENCSCVAYSHDDGIGCMSWNYNLLDIQQLSSRGLTLYVRVDSSELEHGMLCLLKHF
ncbi:G-type lectin S-receptor-like serine/threonine-protein kinase At1g11300 [Vigna radiata var. radiata]|uniref:G-type lectin S-receptor-like serine/threonine-protein kinase At1g11300 n=1 Tax=Vigna radiata var. radiata TaxID=3916 RepID=A0A1S3TSG7_VIGRR|nr:G-type lectin S-receptor-like serine/threonine-protein kinase At1g11300 [Vigna radiata var. radiata]